MREQQGSAPEASVVRSLIFFPPSQATWLRQVEEEGRAWSVSACSCSSSPLREQPPSTRSSFSSVPASARIASTTSRVCAGTQRADLHNSPGVLTYSFPSAACADEAKSGPVIRVDWFELGAHVCTHGVCNSLSLCRASLQQHT